MSIIVMNSVQISKSQLNNSRSK